MNEKKMSLMDLVFMGMGGCIGAGIFSMLGVGIGYTGRAVWLAFIIAMIFKMSQQVRMVIMASMVQKEKAADLEGYKIASVFYNRLRKPAEFPMLNCDSTIIYAQDVYAGSSSIIDAYDTYEIRGLPPTPISNPGLSSLDAALEPEDTSYYYFVLNKDANEHVFARTYAEHQRNLQKYGYYD